MNSSSPDSARQREPWRLLISLCAVICATIVAYHWTTVRNQPVRVRVDTVRVVTTVLTYDTVTVVSRARDTVRVTELRVGPLTQQRLARLMCPESMIYGDARDTFNYNAWHMIFCPR